MRVDSWIENMIDRPLDHGAEEGEDGRRIPPTGFGNGAKEKRSGGEPPLLFAVLAMKDRLLDLGLEEPDFELSIVVFATENLDSAIDNAEHETI